MLNQDIQVFAQKTGDLYHQALFNPTVGGALVLQAVTAQNADIAKTLGNAETDPDGLLAVFEESLKNPALRGRLPSTTLSAAALREEYLGQLRAEARRLSPAPDSAQAPLPLGNKTLLDELDTLKSAAADILYKKQPGEKKPFYPGISGLIEKQDLGIDPAYTGILLMAQAAARLQLAHETAHTTGEEQIQSRAAWQQACLAEPTSKNVRDLEALGKSLDSRQLQFARKDISDPKSSEEKKLGSRYQLSNHLGHVLTCLVELHPELLQQPEIKTAIDAMGALAQEQFKTAAEYLKKANAKAENAPTQGLLRSDLHARLLKAGEQEKLSVSYEKDENPLLDFVKRLWDGVQKALHGALSFVKGLFGRTKEESSTDLTSLNDQMLTAVAVASEKLSTAPGHPSNQPPAMDEETKKRFDAYIAQQAKDVLGETPSKSALVEATKAAATSATEISK
jgi:hypothetical protein